MTRRQVVNSLACEGRVETAAFVCGPQSQVTVTVTDAILIQGIIVKKTVTKILCPARFRHSRVPIRAIEVKNAPLVTDRIITRGGILNKGTFSLRIPYIRLQGTALQ